MAEPFLKYAGGKRWLVPQLVPLIQRHLGPHGKYVEPFLGGGAVALAMPPGRKLLADVLEPLIETWQAVIEEPYRVYAALGALHVDPEVRKDYYYTIRAWQPTTRIQRAARWIYLNRYGFNGLWRTNRDGEFNVPYGDGRGRMVFLDELVGASEALVDAEIVASDYATTIQRAGAGDVLYLDPPYDVSGDGFTEYASGGFDARDQAWLAYEAGQAWQRGATVFATNADTERVRDLWGWMEHRTNTAERRSVNRDGAGRAPVACLLMGTAPLVVESALAEVG